MLYNILLIVQIVVALSIIGLVLIQHGKGADAGAAFGGGASGTVFGSKGSGNFLTRLTTGLAVVFFSNSLMLAWLVAHPDNIGDNQSIVPAAITESSGVAPAPTAPVDIPGGSTTEASSDPEPAAPTTDDAPSDVPK